MGIISSWMGVYLDRPRLGKGFCEYEDLQTFSPKFTDIMSILLIPWRTRSLPDLRMTGIGVVTWDEMCKCSRTEGRGRLLSHQHLVFT